MSLSDAARFIDAIETDETFAQQLEVLKESPEQVLDAVRSRGFDVEPEEIRTAFLERYGDELTEEQLAAIAGGARRGAHGDPAFAIATAAISGVGLVAIAASF